MVSIPDTVSQPLYDIHCHVKLFVRNSIWKSVAGHFRIFDRKSIKICAKIGIVSVISFKDCNKWSFLTPILKLQGFSKMVMYLLFWAQLVFHCVYICEWTDRLIISSVAVYSCAQSILFTRHWVVRYFPNRMI